jgi:Kef-type K+ transport system membrane component KefB
MEHVTQNLTLPVLLILGMTIIVSFYSGKSMKYVKLPSIIGYMFLGVILGPSLLNLLSDGLQVQLSFITEIALGFVALSIGIELNLVVLKKLGKGIIYIIFAESFGAFILVFVAVYLLTGNLPLALIFGAIAPASAPAGTVAVIQEYKTKGSLTKALYAIVGFDDGLGIIIFGFASAIARIILLSEAGKVSENFWAMMWHPLKEVVLSFLFGGIIAVLFSLLARKLKHAGDVLILIVGFTFVANGICFMFHLSLILTNMIIGMIVVNTQPHALVQKIHDRLPLLMPLLFILFFTLAGANLHLKVLPSLGLLGIIYTLARAGGLIGGSRIGAMFGHVEEKIKKYVGLGILSQAGVAIGLSLIVKHEFQGLGKLVDVINKPGITSGDEIGTTVITTITATCIFFEIIGPICTKIALQKAGEIGKARRKA